MMSGMNVFSFLAIPFFIFSGELMLHGGVADKIVRSPRVPSVTFAAGWGCPTSWRARCSAACCGSAVADVSAMGAVMIPMMKKEGYHADYAVNVTTHAALVGALMPTSHNMIIYALAAGGAVSISALIVAGLLPALVLMLCMLAAAYLVAVKRGYPAGTFPGWNAVGRAAIAGVPGIADHRHHSGGDSVGRVHRNGGCGGRRDVHDPAGVPGVSHDDLESLSGGGGEGGENDRRRIAADRRVGDVPVPDGLYELADFTGNLVATISTTPWIVFLVINVILFVLGTFMDMAATILICTPIFLPIAMKYGMTRYSSAW